MRTLSKRNPEMEQEVLNRMAEGEPLAVILRSDRERFPSAQTWAMWCKQDAALDLAHTCAREAGFDVIAADCLKIVDDGTNDWMARREARDGQPEQVTFNAEHVQRSKLRFEARMKLLACWDWKRYGPRVGVTDGEGKPLQAGNVSVNLSGMTPDQLRAIAAARLEGDS